MAARIRRQPGWADVPDIPPPDSADLELMGLRVMVTVMERMTGPERRRTLAHLNDRYSPAPVLADRYPAEVLYPPPEVPDAAP